MVQQFPTNNLLVNGSQSHAITIHYSLKIQVSLSLNFHCPTSLRVAQFKWKFLSATCIYSCLLDNYQGVADLMGHSLRTTEQHYNLRNTQNAAVKAAESIKKVLKQRQRNNFSKEMVNITVTNIQARYIKWYSLYE